MNKPPIFILWDASFLWGLLALRGLRQLKLNCHLVSSKDIAHGGLAGKHARNGLLLAPGGNARQKYASLGASGQKAILEWVAGGGSYLGFCGGAGLGLTGPDGLGLCPLAREPYSSRLFHLLSGHVLAETKAGRKALPVWWPGKFANSPCPGLETLASIIGPGSDLRLADMPLPLIPPDLVGELEKSAGHAGQLLPAGQPLALAGKFGKGKYILSYAHLETPESPAANQWLASLLRDYGACEIMALPAWHTWEQAAGAESCDCAEQQGFRARMWQAWRDVAELFALGRKLDFFYPRESWLCGWRPGFPGMGANNLAASLACLASLPEDVPEPASWASSPELFKKLSAKFFGAASALLWRLKLKKALKSLSDKSPIQGGDSALAEIFGQAMPGGGLVEELAALCCLYIYEMQDWIFME